MSNQFMKLNRGGPGNTEIRICPLCFTPYRSKVEPKSPCPICNDSEEFASGYLACWYDIQEQQNEQHRNTMH